MILPGRAAHLVDRNREERREMAVVRSQGGCAKPIRAAPATLYLTPGASLTTRCEVLCFRARMDLRFYIDPETGLPHIDNHNVTEIEVEDVLESPGEDRPGRDGARIALGQTTAGRYLRVVYVPDPNPNSVFVITAFELKGRPLQAYKRRRKRKPS